MSKIGRIIGEVTGTIVGMGVGTIGGIVAGGLTLIKTNGDTEEASNAMGHVLDTCIEQGTKIGGECETFVETAALAALGAVVTHETNKALNKDTKNDNNKKA
jgi:hypothetical protein